ncbi:hypothetical protein pdam_00005381 [Pocillopora damicornis]|uniref:Uncharacterized protein n=1 Tax=Pocillopora damicornis TaxID=46731 RepID=A0A3M6U2N0_POCDA|nr:hypothetical protein pdam_00005381 [Pocillopora damicornis]
MNALLFQFIQPNRTPSDKTLLGDMEEEDPENFVMVHTIAERLIVPEEFGSVLIAADVSVQNKTSSGTLFRRQKDYFMF